MLLLYSKINTSRSQYIFDLIFGLVGLSWKFTDDPVYFENFSGEKINYSGERIKEEFHIQSAALLSENIIKRTPIPVGDHLNTKILFPNDSSCDLGFDIFSAAFYLVSRYEEYVPFSPDKFGRYPSTESMAYKHDFLSEPVINTWANLLKQALLKKFGVQEPPASSFQAVLTYDIDVAYKYRGRTFTRATGAFSRDLLKGKFNNMAQRMLTLFRLKEDPWDVYGALARKIHQTKLPAVFFFLLADTSHYDKNLSHRSRVMKHLIREIISFAEPGIHPSFYTSILPQKIKVEKLRLEKITGGKITKSRQHFLKFSLPDTYNALLEAGIEEDYSMGYADRPGFRAGICTPYFFYDLKNEKATALKIFPVTCMEVNFIDYLETTPAEALEQILALIKKVDQVKGTFISIWHNNSLGNENGSIEWKKVHASMIEELAACKTTDRSIRS